MIGFGRMGGFYLEQMQKSGRWEVAYICDVSAESREEARRLAPQAQVIADEQIIFDDPEVAVGGLFALADSRLSQIGKAVAAGKHIIAEKPIADSVEREWQAVSLVEKAPLFSTVLMLSIIQGLYILREDEGEELEKRQNKKKRNQQKNDPGAKKKRRPDEETERRKKSGSRNDGQGTCQKYREQPDEFERRIEEQTENSLHW